MGLKELRQSIGFSQTSLAKELGISKTAISYIETGRRRPPLGIALRLIIFFGSKGIKLTIDDIYQSSR
ncbi:MAG: XRE family transcriptional regulator [Candidatus Acidulodesulfobacterium ferriphilum]|uniref:XRE family transcriptional regulator n=1 Tax=Candidatus Acidulodesulfobacterium ferriphilum TaxID=2597223 RepID=A0A519BAJ9_9DELT|nr:MAG: XRE family transcriptional regulator [Candidatus Acidulodesulfobacterium ferriphilum]